MSRTGGRSMAEAGREPGRPADRVDVARVDRLRAVRGRRLRRRFLGPAGRRYRTWGQATRADRALARPGLGGQPRLADLRAGGALDRLPARVRGHRLHPVPATDPGRVRDDRAWVGVRVPQVGALVAYAPGLRCRVRVLLGGHPVLPGYRRRCGRVRSGTPGYRSR